MTIIYVEQGVDDITLSKMREQSELERQSCGETGVLMGNDTNQDFIGLGSEPMVIVAKQSELKSKWFKRVSNIVIWFILLYWIFYWIFYWTI